MRLIIRCPVRPVAYSPEDWSSQDLYFSWAQSTDDHFKQVLDLDALPVAESVLAIIPGIDVRLTALKVPTVSNKKIIQLLPMLIEDECYLHCLKPAFSCYLRCRINLQS